MASVSFKAHEYQADATFRETSYRYEGTCESGWLILREDVKYLELPPGYRLLQSLRCGICSTDLARHFHPFPLPQIIGHEVLAQDEGGRAVCAEINASHQASGSPLAATCPFCSQGLSNHCPDRLVLGIDRLPGGFAPWILVPKNNIVEVPPGLSPRVSVLIEPFAAALHAARRMGLRRARRVAVLGAGRLGLLIVAALRCAREDLKGSFYIEAIDRNPARLHIASSLGADAVWPDGDSASRAYGGRPCFDIVVESTGSQTGLEMAVSLAHREVHIKSTTGRESMGIAHLTEMVVDEVSVERFDEGVLGERLGATEAGRTALLLGEGVVAMAAGPLEKAGFQVRRSGAIEAPQEGGLALDDQAHLVVVESIRDVDRVMRPWPGVARGLVSPRGTIMIADIGRPRKGLEGSIARRGLRLTTSRCGDFRDAISFLPTLEGMGMDLGILVTETLPASLLPLAFERARSPENIKVGVVHET